MDRAQIKAVLTAVQAGIDIKIAEPLERRVCQGGCIHSAEVWTPNVGPSFFIKWGDHARADMFHQEAIGLATLAATHTVRTPKVIATIDREELNFSALILEAVEVHSPHRSNWYAFGQQLAEMHKVASSARFGFEGNNYLGSAKQLNAWQDDWVEFFASQRLGFQLQWLVTQYGSARLIASRCEHLIADLRVLLQDGLEPPTLIHGDLWDGNVIFDRAGQAFLIDPAVYYGQREAEWGMINLFGGFPPEFREGYCDIWPLKSGSQVRTSIYRLYHCLNHWNLFGERYLPACDQELRKLGY